MFIIITISLHVIVANTEQIRVLTTKKSALVDLLSENTLRNFLAPCQLSDLESAWSKTVEHKIPLSSDCRKYNAKFLMNLSNFWMIHVLLKWNKLYSDCNSKTKIKQIFTGRLVGIPSMFIWTFCP